MTHIGEPCHTSECVMPHVESILYGPTSICRRTNPHAHVYTCTRAHVHTHTRARAHRHRHKYITHQLIRKRPSPSWCQKASLCVRPPEKVFVLDLGVREVLTQPPLFVIVTLPLMLCTTTWATGNPSSKRYSRKEIQIFWTNSTQLTNNSRIFHVNQK